MSFLGWGADEPNPEESREFVRKAREQRGKFIRVYDDITGEELSEKEIKELEEARDSVVIPMLVGDFEDVVINRKYHKIRKQDKEIKCDEKKPRKYKGRLSIPSAKRQAVLELYDRRCMECGKQDANQIHHADHDSSNNNIKNLHLLCYDCHLKKHKKRPSIQY